MRIGLIFRWSIKNKYIWNKYNSYVQILMEHIEHVVYTLCKKKVNSLCMYFIKPKMYFEKIRLVNVECRGAPGAVSLKLPLVEH